MMDYSKLFKTLRCVWIGDDECRFKECPYWSNLGCKSDIIGNDAAAAIEALQAEVDKANKSADAYRAMYFTKHGDITIEKVRELDEIDCHFHSALIRLMYKRIEELEAEEKSRKETAKNVQMPSGAKMEVQDESISKFADGEWWKEAWK